MIRRVYGLGIESAITLPEIAVEAGAADVRISLGPPPDDGPEPAWTHEHSLPSGERWLSYAKQAGRHLLRFHRATDFVIDARGEAILAQPQRGLAEETLRHLVLDHVLPLTLNVRGRDALHATAVLTPRGLVALLGSTGLGKSTLAASFALAGYPVACDDCLVVSCDDGGLRAHAGYPGLRLTGETVAALGIDASEGPQAPARKRRVLLGPQLASFDQTFPLVAVYALGRDEDPTSTPRLAELAGREAFVELADASFRLDVDDAPMLARQLTLFGDVAAHARLARLVVPRSLDAVLAARDVVLNDLAI